MTLLEKAIHAGEQAFAAEEDHEVGVDVAIRVALAIVLTDDEATINGWAEQLDVRWNHHPEVFREMKRKNMRRSLAALRRHILGDP